MRNRRATTGTIMLALVAVESAGELLARNFDSRSKGDESVTSGLPRGSQKITMKRGAHGQV